MRPTALVLGVVVEADRGGAAGDGRRLVEGGVGNGEPIARGHVALGILGSDFHQRKDRL